MRLVRKIAAVAGGATLASAAWASYMLTRTGIKSNVDPGYFFSPFELGVPYEPAVFYNSEGLRLVGWWLARSETNAVVLLCPGYGRSKSDLLGLGSRLWHAGYNILMFDFRDQGESDPAIATIGHLERDDMAAALDYALWRVPGARVGVIGYSMGAAVSIMTAAERPEIAAVVADSSFARLGPVLRLAFRQLTHLPPSPVIEIAELLVWLRAGYRFTGVRPLDYVGRISPRPILIIHGARDTVAPVEDARELYEVAGEPKELWIDDTCGHCGVYFVDRSAYVERVLSFLGRWLSPADVGTAAPLLENTAS